MKLVVGLGNPGREYAETRHNVGFFVADAAEKVVGTGGGWVKKCGGLVARGRVDGEDIVFLKPQTFMNLSGSSVQQAVAFYKIDLKDVFVVHDELDVPLAQLKYKVGGGDAGHNGLKSITAALGAGYGRLRFGIGRPVHKSQVSDYVLHPFDADEALTVAERIAWIAEHLPGLLADPHATLAKLKVAA